jgi:hypothetical protein
MAKAIVAIMAKEAMAVEEAMAVLEGKEVRAQMVLGRDSINWMEHSCSTRTFTIRGSQRFE